MEFLKRQSLDQGNDKVMADMLALLDGLTVQQAESILNNLSIVIKKSHIKVSDISPVGDYNQKVGQPVLEDITYPIGKSPLIDFNPLP